MRLMGFGAFGCGLEPSISNRKLSNAFRKPEPETRRHTRLQPPNPKAHSTTTPKPEDTLDYNPRRVERAFGFGVRVYGLRLTLYGLRSVVSGLWILAQ